MQSRILLIDDDERSTGLVRDCLEQAGHMIFHARDGRSGLESVRSLLPHLIVSEVVLPALDGMELCRQVKANSRTASVPLMFLTVRTSEMDQIAGLSLGADDYLGKPPHAQLLVHRVQALLRRREQPAAVTSVLMLHGIEMNRQYYSAWIGKQSLDLTRTEFELLWTLMAQPGRPFSRHELLDYARGQNTSAMERTIDVHVKSLRQKLGAAGEMVETVRGIGYRIARP